MIIGIDRRTTVYPYRSRNRMSLVFGSLFSGIGGLDLGFERSGLKCEWQVEIDPFCQRVLEKHWPNVRRHDDIRTFPPTDPNEWRVDVLCGGFPCQDVSLAGKGAGLDGERSGLWFEYKRIIRILRPRYIVVENVPGLLVRGFDRVLGDLADLGFDAEWSVLSACSLGAPHARERVFIVAYPDGIHRNGWSCMESSRVGRSPIQFKGLLSLPASHSRRSAIEWLEREPSVGRMVNGFPGRAHQLKTLGNSVVPQVAEWIGRNLVASLNQTS